MTLKARPEEEEEDEEVEGGAGEEEEEEEEEVVEEGGSPSKLVDIGTGGCDRRRRKRVETGKEKGVGKEEKENGANKRGFSGSNQWDE